MNGKNSLVPSSPFDTNSQDIEDTRVAILNNTETASQLALMKQNIEARKRALAVAVEENKVLSTQRLAEKLASLDSILVDDEVLEAVKDGIINSKDPAKAYSDFAKASTEIYNRMMKQQLSSADPENAANKTGKSIKIAVTDSTGTTMVAID